VTVDTGLRLMELFGCRGGDIRVDNSTIVVPRERAKNSKERSVPFTEATSNVLATINVARRELVFSVDPARSTKGLRDVFHAIVKRAVKDGLIDNDDIEWHDLRRTAGCRWLNSRVVSLHEVSKWLGHSDVAITAKHYAFLGDMTLHKARDSYALHVQRNGEARG
jgi:integrase